MSTRPQADDQTPPSLLVPTLLRCNEERKRKALRVNRDKGINVGGSLPENISSTRSDAPALQRGKKEKTLVVNGGKGNSAGSSLPEKGWIS
jgi:hypothetical protein